MRRVHQGTPKDMRRVSATYGIFPTKLFVRDHRFAKPEELLPSVQF